VVARDVTAVGVCYTTKFIDTSYEGTDEAKVDEGHKEGIGARAMVSEEGSDCPCCGEHRYDEEYEDVIWCQGIISRVLMHKPRQHSKCWDESDDFEEAPEGEHETTKHDCGWQLLRKLEFPALSLESSKQTNNLALRERFSSPPKVVMKQVPVTEFRSNCN